MSTWLKATLSEASFDRREGLAIARHEGRVFNKRVTVEAGKGQNIEVVAR